MAADRGTPARSKVSHRRAPEVVRDPLRHLSGRAGGEPRPAEIPDGPAVAVEHPRDYLACRALELPRPPALPLEDRAERRCHREHPALPVLRLAGLEPEPAGLEVHVRPLAREELRADAPAGDIGDLGHRPERLGERGKHGTKLRRLEEALARVVLPEHRDVRPVRDLAGDLTQPEHALQCGELAVDGGVGGLRRLPYRHVRGDPVRRQVAGPRVAEVVREMPEPGFHPPQRATLVGAVVVAEHLAQVLERGALDLRPVHPAAADLAQLSLEEPDRVGPGG